MKTDELKMAYRKGREELAKMLIKRFDPDRPPTSEGAYYYPNCGEHHDRDRNAARNILSEGLRILSV